MNKQNDGKEKLCYFELVIVAILLALIVTYGVLYIMIPFGEYGLFLGGAIVGGLWGNVWNMGLFFDKRVLQGSSSPSGIGILIACLIFCLIAIIIVWPLPTIV